MNKKETNKGSLEEWRRYWEGYRHGADDTFNRYYVYGFISCAMLVVTGMVIVAIFKPIAQHPTGLTASPSTYQTEAANEHLANEQKY